MNITTSPESLKGEDMDNTLRQWGLVIIVTLILLMGCGATHEATKQPSSQKETEEAKPTVNHQASNEKTIANPAGTPSITRQPAEPEKNRRPITPAQAKTESSSPSMTTEQIQQRLSELGYQPGPADGKIGKNTIKALKKFQQDNNLPVTGKADNETVNKLRQKTAKDNREQDSNPRTPKAEAPGKAKPVKARSPIDSIL
jgi:peptidoglycan hydrolase-like protein with peptidoglycan-binding domain